MPFPAVHPALDRALINKGYAEPTPVQAAVLEGEHADRDLLVSAQTGSGKTVAFGLADGPDPAGRQADLRQPGGAPLCLAIAPTRELAMQVAAELQWLYADSGAKIATCVGGMDARREARALSQGVHIVVGTPGRLKDHIDRGNLDLSELKVAVLDEADEMLDMGFREDLEFILDHAPAERRTLLFSATIAREIVHPGQALSEGRGAHRRHRQDAPARRHRIPRLSYRPERDRTRGGQHPALVRGAARHGLLLDARPCATCTLQPA
jgi:ATP-dependent RNA helicase DeaD